MEIKTTRSVNSEYEYETRLERIDLDKERMLSLLSNNGFIINEVQSKLKKELKNLNGIYSPKFGQTLDDVNPFIDKYKCECGALKSTVNEGIICEICSTVVKFVDDNFGYFGWIVLDEHYIIHPNMYNMINKFFGKNYLANIIEYKKNINIDGNSEDLETTKDEPFMGIGMIEFRNRFDEILEFYRIKNKSNKNKHMVYDDIIENRDIIFTQSIPVYTTLLRPYKLDGIDFTFEETNKLYNMMTALAVKLKKFHESKNKKTNILSVNKLLLNMQDNYNELVREIEKILNGKKGVIRSVFGGRCSFTSRNVITPRKALRIDEIVMPMSSMIELMQQTIINLLMKSGMSSQDAYQTWYDAQHTRDERVSLIVTNYIKSKPRGIPVIINRNPTINYGGILQMYVIGVVDNYTMGLPLQILPLMAADFDGDVLNIMYIINKGFYEGAKTVFNPRNCFYISSNDGKLEMDVVHAKDTIINLNSCIYLSRSKYSESQINKINMIKQKRGW